jgi:type IV secretion system protein VirB3
MDYGDEELISEPLFVGLTRPATLLGIPYMACVLNVMAVAVIFLAFGNPLFISFAVPIHGILYAISADDPGRFNAIYVWTITVGVCQNRFFWMAASFSPLPKKERFA